MDNTSIDINKKMFWFWNQNANKLESNSKFNGYSDSKKDLKLEAKEKGSKTEKKNSLSKSTKRNKME